MKTEKDKEIDNIFKKGLQNPSGVSPHVEDDWNAMEQMLDEGKRKPFIIYWLPLAGAIAAMLLVLIGWWVFKPKADTKHQVTKFINTKSQKTQPEIVHTGKNEGKNYSLSRTRDAIIADKAKPNVAGLAANKAAATKTIRNSNNQKGSAINNTAFIPTAILIKPEISLTIERNTRGGDQLEAFDEMSFSAQSQLTNQNIGPLNIRQQYLANAAVPINKSKIKISNSYRPQFAISVIASSDKNGVSSFQQSKPGNNAGLLFSVELFKKFTISTGAIYSAKQYMTDFAGYHTSYQFATNPVSVLADCKMLDIPLNIDYQLYNKHRNKISLGTGFSSYLMLNEKYQFNYAAYANGPAKYSVQSPDKYLFSIMNIQATYTRQINSKVGLSFEPYLKLPLSAVGASQVKLQSTGIAVGLTWNLNTLKH